MSEMISIKLDDKDILNALDRLASKINNRAPLMRDIAAAMKSAVQDNFIREGRPDKWPQSKRAQEHGGQTLRKSGRLFSSIIDASDNNSAIVGTNVIYAAIHHFGGETKPRIITAKNGKALKIPGIGFRRSVRHPGSVIPARPFMTLTQSDIRGIIDRIDQYLMKR